MTNYEPLWYWIQERENMRVKKDRGDPPPWTKDVILHSYRFCNVRREDDRVTRFVREHIRNGYAGDPCLWLHLCTFRYINWPDTWLELEKFFAIAPHVGFIPRMASVLNARAARGEKVFTGAYIIPSSSVKGSSRSTHVAENIVQPLWLHHQDFERLFQSRPSMQRVHAELIKFNGWGPFLAYQAVVDMRFTYLLENAPDTQTWAAAGPGTLRGLNRVHERNINHPLGQELALELMQEIYGLSYEATGVEMDFSDVPNVLCETDKYLRVKRGEGTPKARYVYGRGS